MKNSSTSARESRPETWKATTPLASSKTTDEVFAGRLHGGRVSVPSQSTNIGFPAATSASLTPDEAKLRAGNQL